jgi:glycyl-tRNA synthetase
MQWWKRYVNDPSRLRLREHADDELAHYSDQCFDVEYNYPWGWGELEGIASRTDYDLSKHAEASGVKLSYFDQQKNDPATGKPGWRYIPYVIEPAAGLTRALLVFLCDAYSEEKGTDAEGEGKTRVLLRLHPRLAPYKAAILPLVKKDGQPEMGEKIVARFRKLGLNVSYDDKQSIGKRYARHDEIGTPFCMTIDNESLSDGQVTVRDRDSTKQTRMSVDAAIEKVRATVQEN